MMSEGRRFLRAVGVAVPGGLVLWLVVLAGSGGVTLAGAASSGARPSNASNGKLIETLTVDAGKLTVTNGTVPLRAGQHYTLVVSGTFSIKPAPPATGTESFDALYCYGGTGSFSCSPPFAGEEFFIGVGSSSFGTSSQGTDIDEFQAAGGPRFSQNEVPYQSSHSYTVDFYPPVSGTLKAGGYDAVFGCGAQHRTCGDTISGTITIKVYSESAPPPGSTVRVTSISGEVTVRHHNGSFTPVAAGTVLGPGDEVFTGVDSHMQVSFEDGDTMQINELTEILVDTLTQKGHRKDIEIQLKLGEIKAHVQKEKSLDTNFEIRSATGGPNNEFGGASVRDSAMTVFFDPSSGTEIVATLSDRSFWQRGSKMVTVPQGREVEVTKSSVSPLAPIGKADARGGVDIERARDLVLSRIDSSATACQLRTAKLTETIRPAAHGWTVTIPVQGKVSGPSVWHVTNGKVSASNPAAKQIAAGC